MGITGCTQVFIIKTVGLTMRQNINEIVEGNSL